MSDDTSSPPLQPDYIAPLVRPKRIHRKLRATILHESGHVLACLVLHVRFSGADIRNNGDALGRVEIDFAAVPLDKQVIILLAGSAAERLIMAKHRTIADWFAGMNDQVEATGLIAALHPDWTDDRITLYLADMRGRAESIVRQHKDTLLVIADRLHERGQIGNGDVAEIWMDDGK